MATPPAITQDIKELIQDIISKEKLNPNSNVSYSTGSEIGDGYLSKSVSVDIDNDQNPVYLFVKYALTLKGASQPKTIYDNEMYFYDIIKPAFEKFLEEHSIEDGFRNVPKCYGTSEKNIIALDNLKKLGYTLFEKEKMMNDNHIVLTLKAYAKFHAISIAYKDQHKKDYQTIISKIQVGYDDPALNIQIMYDVQKQMIRELIAKWDPVEDKGMFGKPENFADNVMKAMKVCSETKDEHSVVLHGDSWSNNIMFFYENQEKENPTDVMLIDWQLLAVGSVVIDLSHFFFGIAAEDVLKNQNYYLKTYHEELCNQIKLLGSDPDVLYPYSLLMEEWKRHSIYGYAMSFILVQMMILSKEEASNLEELIGNTEGTEVFKMAKMDEYTSRMKCLTKHMLDNGLFHFDKV